MSTPEIYTLQVIKKVTSNRLEYAELRLCQKNFKEEILVVNKNGN